MFEGVTAKTINKHLKNVLAARPDLEESLMPEEAEKDASKKTAVIEWIFDQRFSIETASLSEEKRTVTMAQVKSAIAAYNETQAPSAHLSDRNVANFFKDIKRNYDGFDRHWPRSVFEKGYSGRQLTGDGYSFEFVPLEDGQSKPSVRLYERVDVQSDDFLKNRMRIETLSLSREKRDLLRSDESHITQITVELRVLERCLSESSLEFESLRHLLNNAKMRQAEIDSVFSGTLASAEGVTPKTVAITCEVKGLKEDVFEDQLVRQVNMLPLFGLKCDLVVPVAVKLVSRNVLQVIEFSSVPFAEAAGTTKLTLLKLSLVELHPPIKSFGA